MKKSLRLLFLLLIGAGFIQHAAAQSQAANLEKYWFYRDRLREKFVVVDENVGRYGVNIPATSIDYGSGFVNWGDGNAGLCHYLSLLSTELWLLKSNDQNYQETLKELYYAMLALERLDMYSEYSLRVKYDIGYWLAGQWIVGYIDPPRDINGFMLRDDVSQGFWNVYKSHFPVPNFSSVFNGPNDAEKIMEEFSQDNIYHMLEGLALVAKLVGTESVANIPINWGSTTVQSPIEASLITKGIKNGTTVNFQLWAQDLVKRYIHYMQAGAITYKAVVAGVTLGTMTNHWLLGNPITGKPVLEGSGIDKDTGLFYGAGVLLAGRAITGENLREQDAFILSNGASENLFNTLLAIGPIQSIVIDWPTPFDKAFDPIIIRINYDDYKVRTLAAIGASQGTGTFSLVRDSRDQPSIYDYEHMPLIYTVLHDPENALFSPGSGAYNYDKALLETLLNAAPASGPNTNNNYHWSADSRLIWPEGLGTRASENIDVSGMDYMMVHNLYYIALRREDFGHLVIPAGSTQYTSGEVRAGRITASNTLDGKTVQYVSSKSIKLAPGFKASQGTKFSATVAVRDGQYNGSLYIDPTPNSGGRIAQHVYTDTGEATYQVTQHATNMPDVAIEVKAIQKSETVTAGKIAVYPNPTTDKINIELGETDDTTATLTLVHSSGTIVREKTFSGSTTSVDVSALPTGIYLVRIKANGRTYTEKISLLH